MYIWKYKIPIKDSFEIEMPRNARVLCVQPQLEFRDYPLKPIETSCIWVKTSGKDELVKRRFVIVGTGNPFDAEGLVYIGTWQEAEGRLVWHLFEKLDRVGL